VSVKLARSVSGECRYSPYNWAMMDSFHIIRSSLLTSFVVRRYIVRTVEAINRMINE
jgi:hypothetical protein